MKYFLTLYIIPNYKKASFCKDIDLYYKLYMYEFFFYRVKTKSESLMKHYMQDTIEATNKQRNRFVYNI